MEHKKPTNAQLQKRIKRAVVHLDRTKNTQAVYFSDKGLRLVSDNDYCVIETNYHRHVFSNITSSGISRPWLYTKRVVEIAIDPKNDCMTKDGFSFSELLRILKAKEDKSEFNICMYYEWFVFNCFHPLYSIGESEVEQFLVYEEYIHNIALNSILLEEKKESMTNRQLLEKLVEQIKALTEDIEERVLFEKKTDEEVAKENIEAAAQMELNEEVEQ